MATTYSNLGFDTLEFAQALIAKGYERENAEALSVVIRDHVINGLATKKDLELLEERMMHKITIRMATIVIGALSAFTFLQKLPFLMP